MRPDPLKVETRIINRAGEYARSGKYEDWPAVQEALMEAGFEPEDVRKALNSGYLRNMLNRSCRDSREVND